MKKTIKQIKELIPNSEDSYTLEIELWRDQKLISGLMYTFDDKGRKKYLVSDNAKSLNKLVKRLYKRLKNAK